MGLLTSVRRSMMRVSFLRVLWVVGTLTFVFAVSNLLQRNKAGMTTVVREAENLDESKASPSEIQSIRRRRIHDVCKRHKLGNSLEDILNDEFTMNHLHYSDEHKLLFCLIPKTGCTNWMRILMVLNKRLTASAALKMDRVKLQRMAVDYSHSNMTIPKLALLKDRNERLKRLKEYFKFTIVRDPTKRLQASYKIYQGTTKHEDKSFSGMINHILERQSIGRSVDQHYDHYYRICRPCSIEYDYIGKFEHLPGDAIDLLKLRDLDKLVTYRDSWVKPKPVEKISRKDDFLISKIYSLDHELFGYEPGQTLPRLPV